jgi:hypothetical protein
VPSLARGASTGPPSFLGESASLARIAVVNMMMVESSGSN